MQTDEKALEFRVLQAYSPAGEPLETFHIFRGEMRVMAFVTEERVRRFFEGKRSTPARDESRWPRCLICRVALREDAPRHVQTPEGLVSRGHRFVRSV